MARKRNKIDFESDEARAKCVKEIMGFFQNERDEQIGFVAAGEMLDFFLQSVGEEIYKKAIGDAKKLIKERNEDLEISLDILSTD